MYAAEMCAKRGHSVTLLETVSYTHLSSWEIAWLRLGCVIHSCSAARV